MKQIKWFDRKFDFSSKQELFPSILERLEGTSIRLEHKLSHIPKEQLIKQHKGSWSIQENVGHLLDLEPLWKGRLEDILLQKDYLRDADLQNTGTHLANHNEKDLQELISQFSKHRNETLTFLRNLNDTEVFKAALHPRLHQPMRTMDLFLFVAEHDDHHLARITALQQELTKS